jgi:hypothetical protein
VEPPHSPLRLRRLSSSRQPPLVARLESSDLWLELVLGFLQPEEWVRVPLRLETSQQAARRNAKADDDDMFYYGSWCSGSLATAWRRLWHGSTGRGGAWRSPPLGPSHARPAKMVSVQVQVLGYM